MMPYSRFGSRLFLGSHALTSSSSPTNSLGSPRLACFVHEKGVRKPRKKSSIMTNLPLSRLMLVHDISATTSRRSHRVICTGALTKFPVHRIGSRNVTLTPDALRPTSTISSTMAGMPQDVLTDILCRLPVKPLLQFRSVSKSWRCLIDSAGFIYLHHKNSTETGSNYTLILRKDSELYSVDLHRMNNAVDLPHPLMCYSNRIQVLGSCNGLLCIANVAEDIALWNPFLRKHKVLPFLPVERNKNYGSGLLGARVFGFGYDPVHEDYKLVRISQFIDLDNEASVSKVKVYSLRENELRDSGDMPYVLCYTRKNGTLASGCLHWVVNRKFKFDEADMIVAFDLTVESFREVPMPECTKEKVQIDVGVLGGCVCMVANYNYLHVDVWVMKEYGVKESWAKLFTVAQDEVFGGALRYLKPLAYSKSREEVLLEHNHNRLVWYDLRVKSVRNVNLGGLPASFEAEICVQSLVPVEVHRKDNDQQQEKDNNDKRDDFLSEGFKLVL